MDGDPSLAEDVIRPVGLFGPNLLQVMRRALTG